MNILQQIIDNSTDFFNYALKKMETPDYGMHQLMPEAQHFANNLVTMMVSSLLEEMDQALYDAVKPTHTVRIKEKARPRTLVTTLGEVRYTRRYYEHKASHTYGSLLDPWMQIPTYARVETACKAQLVAHAADASYAKAASQTTPCALSRQSVMNAIRQTGTLPNDAAPLPQPKEKMPRVFIEADEDHVAMREGKAKPLKLVYVYEDKVTVGKNRRQLVGTRMFTGYEKSADLWREVDTYLQQAYPGKEAPEVSIIGDGAYWIQSGTNHIYKGQNALDAFHVTKYIRKIAGNGNQQKLYQALRENQPNAFQDACRYFEIKRPGKKQAIRKGQHYIQNHWESIQRTLRDSAISSSTECHVSHLLSERLSSRGMGWSPKGSEQIARLRTMKCNGGDVIAYVEKKLTAPTPQISSMIATPILKKQVAKHVKPYCNQAEIQYAMPGSESALHSWMRAIEHSGFMN